MNDWTCAVGSLLAEGLYRGKCRTKCNKILTIASLLFALKNRNPLRSSLIACCMIFFILHEKQQLLVYHYATAELIFSIMLIVVVVEFSFPYFSCCFFLFSKQNFRKNKLKVWNSNPVCFFVLICRKTKTKVQKRWLYIHV